MFGQILSNYTYCTLSTLRVEFVELIAKMFQMYVENKSQHTNFMTLRTALKAKFFSPKVHPRNLFICSKNKTKVKLHDDPAAKNMELFYKPR